MEPKKLEVGDILYYQTSYSKWHTCTITSVSLKQAKDDGDYKWKRESYRFDEDGQTFLFQGIGDTPNARLETPAIKAEKEQDRLKSNLCYTLGKVAWNRLTVENLQAIVNIIGT